MLEKADLLLCLMNILSKCWFLRVISVNHVEISRGSRIPKGSKEGVKESSSKDTQGIIIQLHSELG